MKRFKNYIVLGMAALLGTSCSDFLDVTPERCPFSVDYVADGNRC